MAKINPNELTKEQIEKAAQCKTAEELMELAKESGVELTKEEAEAFLAEGGTVDLSDEEMEAVAGGGVDWICDNECNHRGCFIGGTLVAVPGGTKPIRDLRVGDEVITLDRDGNEVVGKVTEEAPQRTERIVEVTFSDGTVWHTTESQTIYLGHEDNYLVKDALGRQALTRDGGKVTVTGVKFTDRRETVYDVLIGEEEDEDVIFVSGIAAEGYFTKGERGLQDTGTASGK